MGKIKWENVLIAIIFVISTLYILSGFITLATSLASLTYYGIATSTIAFIIMGYTGEYLYEQI